MILVDIPHHPPCRVWSVAVSVLRISTQPNLLLWPLTLAALAMEHNGSRCSVDADFRRFPGLRLINPLA